MDNDTIRCEAPGPGGLTCDLPYGHDLKTQPHHFSVMLPPDLGALMETMMRQAEEARLKYEKAHRHERKMFYIWVVLCCLYLGLTLVRVFG